MQSSKHLEINTAIDRISDYAPVVLFIMMLLMFCMTGWLQHKFLAGIFSDVIPDSKYIALLFPIVIQVLRLVTGFLSASFLKKGSYFFGVIVLLFSLWLSAFEYNEVGHMADFWTGVDLDLSVIVQADLKVTISKSVISNVMTVLIWGAMVLEFFLAGWLTAVNRVEKDNRNTDKRNTDNTDKRNTDKRECIVCGNDITNRRKNAKYCSDDCRSGKWFQDRADEKKNGTVMH